MSNVLDILKFVRGVNIVEMIELIRVIVELVKLIEQLIDRPAVKRVIAQLPEKNLPQFTSMLWFKKHKFHRPFDDDWDLHVWQPDDENPSAYFYDATVPDNTYFHILSIVFKLQTFAGNTTYPTILVHRGGISVHSCLSSLGQIQSTTQYWSWAPGQVAMRPPVTNYRPTCHLGAYMYVAPNDLFRIMLLPLPGGPVISNLRISCKRWRIY